MMSRFSNLIPKALLLCALLILISSPASSKSWEEAIRDVESLRQSFIARYEALGFDGILGTAYNEVDVNMHHCAILGRMVGHKAHIAHLEPPQPGLDSSGRDLAIAATSLGNWLIAARYHSQINSSQKRRIWNLECVGNFGIPNGLWVEVEDGFDVAYDPDRKAIMIQGDITVGFSEAVRRAIEAYPDAEVVGLGSGGGAVYEAIEAGRLIRSAGLQTEALNNCYSACPLAFLGGTLRFMWYPHSDMGFHQVSSNGIAVPLTDSVYIDIKRYVSEMGGNAPMILSMMYSTPPSGMYYASQEERCLSRVVTNHQRGCLAPDN